MVVLYFSASWSEECNLMSDVIKELAKNEKTSRSTKFLQIEAEEFEDLSVKYGIEAVPTFLFLKVKEI